MAPINGLTPTPTAEPLFSFGLIADVQYADIPDGHSVYGIPRYYRHSLLVLQRAVQSWNGHGSLSFAINLGDIVDGFCPKDASLKTVQKLVYEFDTFNGPVHHMIGNHCLYNLPRTDLLPLLKIPGHETGRAYYEFAPSPGYRFVVLDGYDVSALGWPEDHPNTAFALNLLSERNPNLNKNSPDGLIGVEKRFVKFNGAVGEEQLEWLDGVLGDASKLDEKVVICSHIALDPVASSDESLIWNYEEVVGVICKYKCVKAILAGHDHRGGYRVDSRGVHHLVLEAALECQPGTDAFGYVNVYEDRLLLVGSGVVRSIEMVFDS